jgi:hypothetical protein
MTILVFIYLIVHATSIIILLTSISFFMDWLKWHGMGDSPLIGTLITLLISLALMTTTYLTNPKWFLYTLIAVTLLFSAYFLIFTVAYICEWVDCMKRKHDFNNEYLCYSLYSIVLVLSGLWVSYVAMGYL